VDFSLVAAALTGLLLPSLVAMLDYVVKNKGRCRGVLRWVEESGERTKVC